MILIHFITTTHQEGDMTTQTTKAADKAQAPATGQPKAAKPKLGPSGYRRNAGTSDQELVKAVRVHAEAHITEGWDVVTEAMTDEEIVAAIGWSTTAKTAIVKLSKIVAVHADRRAEAAQS
jgi:HD superfamily phosphohydrolase YqeK